MWYSQRCCPTKLSAVRWRYDAPMCTFCERSRCLHARSANAFFLPFLKTSPYTFTPPGDLNPPSDCARSRRQRLKLERFAQCAPRIVVLVVVIASPARQIFAVAYKAFHPFPIFAFDSAERSFSSRRPKAILMPLSRDWDAVSRSTSDILAWVAVWSGETWVHKPPRCLGSSASHSCRLRTLWVSLRHRNATNNFPSSSRGLKSTYDFDFPVPSTIVRD